MTSPSNERRSPSDAQNAGPSGQRSSHPSRPMRASSGAKERFSPEPLPVEPRTTPNSPRPSSKGSSAPSLDPRPRGLQQSGEIQRASSLVGTREGTRHSSGWSPPLSFSHSNERGSHRSSERVHSGQTPSHSHYPSRVTASTRESISHQKSDQRQGEGFSQRLPSRPRSYSSGHPRPTVVSEHEESLPGTQISGSLSRARSHSDLRRSASLIDLNPPESAQVATDTSSRDKRSPPTSDETPYLSQPYRRRRRRRRRTGDQFNIPPSQQQQQHQHVQQHRLHFHPPNFRYQLGPSPPPHQAYARSPLPAAITPAYGDSMQQRARSPGSQASAPLFAYTLLLHHTHLVPFLIGPRGSRSQSIQQLSNLVSLTFRILTTPSRPVAEMKGSRNSIRKGVENISNALEAEVRLGMESRLVGPLNRWCVVVDRDISALGLTRDEWFLQRWRDKTSRAGGADRSGGVGGEGVGGGGGEGGRGREERHAPSTSSVRPNQETAISASQWRKSPSDLTADNAAKIAITAAAALTATTEAENPVLDTHFRHIKVPSNPIQDSKRQEEEGRDDAFESRLQRDSKKSSDDNLRELGVENLEESVTSETDTFVPVPSPALTSAKISKEE